MNVWSIAFLVLFATCSLQQESSDPEENVETTPDPNEEEEEEGLQSNDPNRVGFYLYPSTENFTYAEEIRIDDSDSLIESSYSPSKPVIILVHGFVNNYTCRFSQRVKNAFLEAGLGNQYNFIVVDWGALSTPKNQTNLHYTPLNDLAKNPFYQAAVRNVPKVGKRIAEFVDFLMVENYLESPNEVYLIGFSLGAQVSGCAGYEVKQNMTTPIGKITGLDPAGPLYNAQQNLALKLDSSDATFVDIIHTNQGQSGYEGNIGHADFYPQYKCQAINALFSGAAILNPREYLMNNGGGPNQNDCINFGSGGVSNNLAGVCAHNRAWVYYIKSITSEVTACKCFATPDYFCKATCSNKVLFGYPCPPTARGTYYVDIVQKDK